MVEVDVALVVVKGFDVVMVEVGVVGVILEELVSAITGVVAVRVVGLGLVVTGPRLPVMYVVKAET